MPGPLRQMLCGLVIVAAAGAGSSDAFAQTGKLDPAFGVRGRTVTPLDFGGSPRFWYAVRVHAALMPGGRIVVAANDLLLRYRADGRLDRSFGDNGRLRIETVEGRPFDLADLAIDSQGRIVVAGTANSVPGSAEFNLRAAVLRFEAGGRPDPSFGGGDGAVMTDFGLQAIPYEKGQCGSFCPSLQVSGVAIDANERIVVAGSATRAMFYCSEAGAYVGRLDAQGAIDSSFGSNGVVAYEPSHTHSADGLVLDPTGASLSFGWDGYCHGDSGETTILIHRLDAGGRADPAFGTEGQLRVRTYPRRLALDGDGRIVVLDGGNLHRLLPSGAADMTFGSDGIAPLPLRGARSGFSDLALTPSNGIVVTGTLVHYFRKRPEPRRRVLLARLGPKGGLDRHFGASGLVKMRFGRPSNAVGRQVVLDGRGHAIVAGTVRNRELPTGQGLALYRFDLRR